MEKKDPPRSSPLFSAPWPSGASQGRLFSDPPTSREDRMNRHRFRGDRRGAQGPSQQLRRLGGGGQGGRRAPPRPRTSRPPGPRDALTGWPGSAGFSHWLASVRSTRPRWRARSRGAVDRQMGRGLHGLQAAGMVGAGLRAAARLWLPCRGHGRPRAASSSPSCPGCGPPGPGSHCPGAPRSAPTPEPASGADLSAYLWARYQDMRRLVHGG